MASWLMQEGLVDVALLFSPVAPIPLSQWDFSPNASLSSKQCVLLDPLDTHAKAFVDSAVRAYGSDDRIGVWSHNAKHTIPTPITNNGTAAIYSEVEQFLGTR